ncbi:unnamed protein product, partial [Ectocarpus sp. 12 AP-2014]
MDRLDMMRVLPSSYILPPLSYHQKQNGATSTELFRHKSQIKQNHPDRGGFSKDSRLLFRVFLEAEEDCGRLLVPLLLAGVEPASSSAAACRAPPLTTGAPARPPSPRRALVLHDERLRFETRFDTTALSPPSPSNTVFPTPPPPPPSASSRTLALAASTVAE